MTQEDVDARARQKTIRWATILLTPYQRGTTTETEPFAMIPAFIQGLAHYRNDDLKAAVTWFNQSAEAAPYPERQKSVIISSFAHINADGSFTLDGNSTGWRVRSDSDRGTSIQLINDAISLTCAPEINSPKSAFVWSQPIAIPYHHSALIEVKIETGTTLIFETVANGELIRHFVHPGTGKMEQIEVVFQDEQLDLIYFLVRNNEESLKGTPCHTEIKFITILLDEAVQ
ncbi:MAG: hypothetical protein GY796_24330 [Chloroflexi bacterium]|nr:hypothetical protein [Chloroflexota bacterium]